MTTENTNNNTSEIDVAKRETLRKLGSAAWAVPVVATFTLGGLSMSSAWAIAGNGVTHS